MFILKIYVDRGVDIRKLYKTKYVKISVLNINNFLVRHV